MRASRSRTREHTNLLTATPDEAALAIACFLTTARDLLSLRLACRRFNIKCIVGGGGGPAAAGEMLCLVEEAARRWVAGCSEQERGWVPRRGLESWLCLMHEVGVLRLPLVFGRVHGSITLSENGAVAAKSGEDYSSRVAASKAVMRSGHHYAQFTIVVGGYMNFGVIRPGWDVEGGAAAYDVAGHCFYFTGDGLRCPGNIAWEGMQTASEGDRIGMLLDLDQGSMIVWKNDVEMGVMQSEGLTGPLCWAISLFWEGESARIDSGALPAQ